MKNLKLYRKALVIVDMINGFVREGNMHDYRIARTIPRQLELIKEYQEIEGLILFIKDAHTKDSTEVAQLGEHALIGTSEQEIIEELRDYEKADHTLSILKNSTSFMEAPKMREVLREATNLREVDIVGCCTDICVCNGAIGMANYFDQQNRPLTIRVHQDAVATYNEEKRKNYVDAAYLLMERQGIQLVKKI